MMSKRYRLKLLWLLLCSSLVMTSVLYGEEEKLLSWTYGGIEYVLPTPIDQIVISFEVPEKYEVVSGDTLWGIAENFLKDPYLWPMIWDLNMDNVPNPHLIFPKQIITLPVPKPPPPPPEPEFTYEEPEMYPLVPKSKLLLSGFISACDLSGPKIIGSEEPIYELSTHDIVYINIGANQGVLPGDTYTASRMEREVMHPITKDKLGFLINNTGLLEIIATQASTSTAIISVAMTAVNVGDSVSVYNEEPVPLTTGRQKIDRFAAPTGKLPGYIVEALGGTVGVSDAHILGSHDIIYVDLGSNNGVLPGDSFIIYRTREKLRSEDYDKFWWEKKEKDILPPVVSGELTVFRVKEKTATAVITQSFEPIFVGASVELRE